MSSVTPAAGPIHLGMDTSKNTIVVGILLPGDEVPVIDRIWNEEGAVRHLVSRLGDPAALLADRKRAQQRITAMLLRHGRVWRSGSYWTLAHEQWIAGQRFGEPARSRPSWRRGPAGSRWRPRSPGWAATTASPS